MVVAPVGEAAGSGDGARTNQWCGESNDGRKKRVKRSLQYIRVGGVLVLQAALHHRIAWCIKHHN